MEITYYPIEEKNIKEAQIFDKVKNFFKKEKIVEEKSGEQYAWEIFPQGNNTLYLSPKINQILKNFSSKFSREEMNDIIGYIFEINRSVIENIVDQAKNANYNEQQIQQLINLSKKNIDNYLSKQLKELFLSLDNGKKEKFAHENLFITRAKEADNYFNTINNNNVKNKITNVILNKKNIKYKEIYNIDPSNTIEKFLAYDMENNIPGLSLHYMKIFVKVDSKQNPSTPNEQQSEQPANNPTQSNFNINRIYHQSAIDSVTFLNTFFTLKDNWTREIVAKIIADYQTGNRAEDSQKEPNVSSKNAMKFKDVLDTIFSNYIEISDSYNSAMRIYKSIKSSSTDEEKFQAEQKIIELLNPIVKVPFKVDTWELKLPTRDSIGKKTSNNYVSIKRIS